MGCPPACCGEDARQERRCEVSEPNESNKPAVTLRPREAVMNARKAEIIRALRDAAEKEVPVPLEWITELAELVDVDIRKR